MNATDLSADLVVVGMVTANLVVGSLIAMRYSPLRCWPHRKLDIFRLHRWTGYAALTLVILHPIPLLFSTIRFRIVDILYPLHSPSQPLENSIGAVALYSVAVVVITSYFRLSLGRRLWKAFHFVIYAAALALFLAQHLHRSDTETRAIGSIRQRKGLHRSVLRSGFRSRNPAVALRDAQNTPPNHRSVMRRPDVVTVLFAF